MILTDYVDNLIAEFSADRLHISMKALEDGVKVAERLVEAAVDALVASNARTYVAERVVMYGSLAVKPLMNVFQSTEDNDVKTHAALCLLHLGHIDGVDWLLRELETDNDLVIVIAHKLTQHGVVETTHAIIKNLRVTRPNNALNIVPLVEAIKKVGGRLPDDLAEALTHDAVTRMRQADELEFSLVVDSLGIISTVGKLQYLPGDVLQRLIASERLEPVLAAFGLTSYSTKLLDHLKVYKFHNLFLAGEYTNAHRFLYTALMCAVDDEADTLEIGSNGFTWQKDGNMIGHHLGKGAPVPDPSYKDCYMKIRERDPVVRDKTTILEETSQGLMIDLNLE